MKFSANLGFLWQELSLPDAIFAAKAAGFDAVECHWPYATPPGEVAAALREANLEMCGINTVRGDVEKGENGLAALPGREAEARKAIDQAVTYARAIDAKAIHIMAGKAEGAEAHASFLGNIRYADSQLSGTDIMLLIEPLNRHDAPGYFLRTTEQAMAIISELALPRLKLLFDCYHTGRTETDVIGRFHALLPAIGHIQFASVPDRGPPDGGEVDYDEVFSAISAAGWVQPLGAEYKPPASTESTLGWLKLFQT
jgi:hydroxypyruvate isomerase